VSAVAPDDPAAVLPVPVPVLVASGPDVMGGSALVEVEAVALSPQATRREKARARMHFTREA
jgi:hypothetical protein